MFKKLTTYSLLFSLITSLFVPLTYAQNLTVTENEIPPSSTVTIQPTVQLTPTPLPTEQVILTPAQEQGELKSTETSDEEEEAPLNLGDDKTEMDALKDMTAVVRQSKNYYCGPAALATLLTQYGTDTNEQSVLDVIPAGEINEKQGTNLLALKNAAEKLNQKVILKKWSVDQVLQYIVETGDPILIHDEKKGVGGHFSVIKSFDADKELVELSDTEAGNIKYSVSDFSHIYTGYVLVIFEGEKTEMLADVSTDVNDADAATIWGMYVPVYLLAQRSGDREAIQFSKDYEACIGRAMNIQDKNARNNARTICYSDLAQKLGKDFNNSQELNMGASYALSNPLRSNQDNESAVGTVTILNVLSNIKTLQQNYVNKLATFTSKRQQLGGMTVQEAQNLTAQISALSSQISQLNYEKTQLQNSINSKKNTADTLQRELNTGVFIQNGQTFQLGNVGNQVNAARSQYTNLSNSLNQKLSSFDGQINQARSQLTNAQNNKRNADNQANNYQNQVNSANNTANKYDRSANDNYSAYQRAKLSQKASYYGNYLWNKAQAVYYRGQASYYQGLTNIQRSYANNYQNTINNLNNRISQIERDKTNARNSATSQINQASAEAARLQRLQDFGNQEMNRKRGLLSQLRLEISQLQPQFDQRVTKINTLNSQLNLAKSKEASSREIVSLNNGLTDIEKQINTLKTKYGFTTINNINTQETDRLKNEEISFETGSDNAAIWKTTQDMREAPAKAVTDGINFIKNNPGQTAIIAGTTVVLIGGSIVCVATAPVCATVLGVAGTAIGAGATVNGLSIITTQKNIFGTPVSDDEWGKAVVMLPIDVIGTGLSSASLKSTLIAAKGVKTAENLAALAVRGEGAESQIAKTEIETVVKSVQVAKATSSLKAAEAWLELGSKTDRVYIAIDEVGKIKYVGKTNDIARRMVEHAERFNIQDIGAFFQKSYNNLTPHQARAIEQYIIDKYGLVNLDNEINSIRATRDIFDGSQIFAQNWLKSNQFTSLLLK